MIHFDTYIDLFSGTGVFHKGLHDAGFRFKNIFFSEKDKYAIANYKINFPDAKYIGTVEHVRIEQADIITFGWPCQDNSIAGNRKGQREGSRSGLLTEAVRIIAQSRPRYFLAENVAGLLSVNEGIDFIEAIKVLAYLNENLPQYNIEMQLLNTAWFLPQNRERLYFVGHCRERCSGQIFPIGENGKLLTKKSRADGGQSQAELCTAIRSTGITKADSTFSTKKVESALVKDGKISGTIRATDGKQKPDGTFIITGVTNAEGTAILSDTANTIDANYHKGMDNHSQRTMIVHAQQNDQLGASEKIIVADNIHPSLRGMNGNVYSEDGIAPTLSTNKGEGNKILVKSDTEVFQLNPSTESNGVQPYQQNRVYDEKGIVPALMVDISSKTYAIAVNEPNDKELIELTENVHEGNRIYDSVGIARTLKSEAGGGAAKMGQYKINQRIRRLTPVDCERLQGLPDGWTEFGVFEKQVWINKKERTFKIVEGKEKISDAQRYKLCGNAVTRDVVVEVATHLRLLIEKNENKNG